MPCISGELAGTRPGKGWFDSTVGRQSCKCVVFGIVEVSACKYTQICNPPGAQQVGRSYVLWLKTVQPGKVGPDSGVSLTAQEKER